MRSTQVSEGRGHKFDKTRERFDPTGAAAKPAGVKSARRLF